MIWRLMLLAKRDLVPNYYFLKRFCGANEIMLKHFLIQSLSRFSVGIRVVVKLS
jgi:hypothetical protein